MKRLFRFSFLLVLLAFTGGMSCARNNPVASATKASPENKAETVAFALHNSYVVLAERAVAIAEDSTTPRTVAQALIAANEKASPAAKKLRQAALDYEKVRKAVAAGTTPIEKLGAALDQLNAVLLKTAPVLNEFANEVGGVS